MGSLFDIPVQLAMLLQFAAASAGHGAAGIAASARAAPEAAVVQVADPLAGPMRFGERAWLQALYENPEQSTGYASRVFVTSGGHFYAPTASDRQQVLAARNDAPLAVRLAQSVAARNAARLRDALGRIPSTADLYIAHVLGARGAVALLEAVAETPDVALEDAFPALVPSLSEAAPALTVAAFYRRLCATLREPPRLVAIGLRSRLDEAPAPAGPDWQATVDIAKMERPLR